MKIPVILNEKEIILDAAPDAALMQVLRVQNLASVKCGCASGTCGSCTVLLDETPVPSCLIPLAAVRGSKIVTLEHFKKTDAYTDIEKGFESAGIQLCGYCDAGKIFAVEYILSSPVRYDRKETIALLSNLGCMCTDLEFLANGVSYAASYRNKKQQR
ncbi:MAG: 2Fe-2S iron-sulfur cluster-binding protein [Treponemataceae bacterium]|nr:MAG: 2Fe-2S iron-sulfur cluster-binding protein [Treponemataceae bacterium]